MDRRMFLRETVMGLGVVACGVGGLWLRRSRSRGQFVDQLMDTARPILDGKALVEQEKIPVQAREAIRAYFDGLILNARDGFLNEARSSGFRAKLSAAKTNERRHGELMNAFFRNVAGDADMLAHVRAVAREFGPELDDRWGECCRSIAAQWKTRLQGDAVAFDADAFVERVTPMVRRQIEQAVQDAHLCDEESEWREAIRSLGAEALQEGREIQLDIGDHSLRVPEFWVKASRNVFSDVLEIIVKTNKDCQEAMTRRLALLGNKLASEFEKEMRQRLNHLHGWQEQAVRLAAEQQAAERVGLFGERA